MLIQRMDKRFEEYENKPETKVAVNESTCVRRSGLSDVFKAAGQILSAFVEATV